MMPAARKKNWKFTSTLALNLICWIGWASPWTKNSNSRSKEQRAEERSQAPRRPSKPRTPTLTTTLKSKCPWQTCSMQTYRQCLQCQRANQDKIRFQWRWNPKPSSLKETANCSNWMIWDELSSRGRSWTSSKTHPSSPKKIKNTSKWLCQLLMVLSK